MLDNQTAKTGIFIIAVIAILTTATVAYNRSSQSDSKSVEVSPSKTNGSPSSSPIVLEVNPTASNIAIKDGVYTVTGSYTSPAGPEEIKVSVTLENNIIREATVESLATNPGSKKFQGQFISGYKQLVVGKNIEEVQLDVVAGSSLTPKGFNEALEKIKIEAQS